MVLTATFSERMDSQRTILKQINQIKWPREQLFALSEDAILRWISVNQLGEDNIIVKLAKEAGDALLFLANISQEQVSPEYVSRTGNVKHIFNRLCKEIEVYNP